MLDYALPHIVKLPRLTPLSVAAATTPDLAATVVAPLEGTHSEADTVSICDRTADDDFDMLTVDFDELDDNDDEDGYHAWRDLSFHTVSSSAAATAGQRDTLSQESCSTVEMSSMDLDADTPAHPSASNNGKSSSAHRPARVKIKAGVRERQEMKDRSNLTLTQNGATTLRSSKDPRVDFFFEVVQSSSKPGPGQARKNEEEEVTRMAIKTMTLVAKSWKAAPLDTLRLIFHLRSVQHGKGERAAFYACLDFLRREHPKTLLYNLQFLPDHGYWKDLLNWVVFECRRTEGSGSSGNYGSDNQREQQMNSTSSQNTKTKSQQKHHTFKNKEHMDITLPSLGYRATTALQMSSMQSTATPTTTNNKSSNSKMRHKLRRRLRRRSLLASASTSASLSKLQHLSLSPAPDKLTNHLTEKAILDSATAQTLARQKRERAEANQQRFEMHQRAKARLARQQRDKARRARLDHASARFEHDAMYRMVHVEVARLFARQLKRDKQALIDMAAKAKAAAVAAASSSSSSSPPPPPVLSLAGKWCPSLNQFHDKHTLISTTIAQILFPDWLPGESEPAYIHRVRQALRTEYYVPLRKALAVPEPLMTSYRWDEIEYSRVPAVAMKTHKELFEKYDEDRFRDYLETVRQGQDTIAAAALMPHQLVHEVLRCMDVRCSRVNRLTRSQGGGHAGGGGGWTRTNQPARDLAVVRETTELQWRSFVERLKKQCEVGSGGGTKGSSGSSMFTSCMAMCDTSDSMKGRPLEAAIGLSLLLAELTEPPFHGQVMSFGEQPVLHQLDPASSFATKVESILHMSAGLNTDLFRAFETLLKKAIQEKVPPTQMVKTLFIFSDMEFDQAVVGGSSGGGQSSVSGKKHKSAAGRQKKAAFSNYHNIQVLYRRKGYELPRIVFWNLRPSAAEGNMPVLATTGDTALVSGFSGMMMKTFLRGGDDLLQDMDPVRVMEAAISGPEFAKLKVLD
ncbi:hypothetical protein DFQ26_007807 [Actinomortierella ambigua]|nr:hypothetical protein DFQ26_007807 [Actinomortierella ambigua]